MDLDGGAAKGCGDGPLAALDLDAAGWLAAGLLAEDLLAEDLLAAGLVAAGLVAAGLVAAGLVAAGLVAAGWLAADLLAAGLLTKDWLLTGLLAAGLLVVDLAAAALPVLDGAALAGTGLDWASLEAVLALGTGWLTGLDLDLTGATAVTLARALTGSDWAVLALAAVLAGAEGLADLLLGAAAATDLAAFDATLAGAFLGVVKSCLLAV